jgi:BirA family transcriptional regulator, biotin operon repressor / biotin---[acetyl-CoA-carboxylase] ligase
LTSTEPNLPGLYELVVVGEADSARAYAERLAARGADEGTLVWVQKQTEGLGRRGNYWISGERNLHCAIILRPEETFTDCAQLSLLASVATSQAITLVGEPLEELRLGWPNDVYLNRGKVAGVHLSGELNGDDRVNWMVVSVNVNTYSHPSSLGFEASSLRGEGFEISDRIEILEGFSREFLAWLNRWADQGLEPVRKAWLWRGNWQDGERTVHLDGRSITGIFDSLDASGALNLETAQGIITVSLGDFYRPEFQINTHSPS